MGRLLRLGASAGIRIILTAHDLNQEWAGNSSRSNLNVRIVSGNDVATSASKVGRGGSGAHNVDQSLRQFVLSQNNQTQTFYAPFLCQGARFMDLNENERDDVEDTIATCQLLYISRPFDEIEQAVAYGQNGRTVQKYAVTPKPESKVNGVTFSDAVVIIRDLLDEKPGAIQADVAEALWGSRTINGPAQVKFLHKAIAEARKEL